MSKEEGKSFVPIYAVDNSTLAIRAKNITIWDQSEPFFWTTDNCFPGLSQIEDNTLDTIEQTEQVLDSNETEEEYFFPIPSSLNSWNVKCMSVWKGGDQIAYAIFSDLN